MSVRTTGTEDPTRKIVPKVENEPTPTLGVVEDNKTEFCVLVNDKYYLGLVPTNTDQAQMNITIDEAVLGMMVDEVEETMRMFEETKQAFEKKLKSFMRKYGRSSYHQQPTPEILDLVTEVTAPPLVREINETDLEFEIRTLYDIRTWSRYHENIFPIHRDGGEEINLNTCGKQSAKFQFLVWKDGNYKVKYKENIEEEFPKYLKVCTMDEKPSVYKHYGQFRPGGVFE